MLPTRLHLVALTFDGGSGMEGLPRIERVLRSENVRATFFLTGSWVGAHPWWARRVAGVYPVGNHTYSHPHMTRLTYAAARVEVLRAQRRLIAVGTDPRPLFRFPYGERDARTIALVNTLGYGSIRWTVDTLGWKGLSAGITPRAIVRRVIDNLRPGEIVLMHIGAAPDGSTLDADALRYVIRAVRRHGYGFVTVRKFV